MNSVAVIFCASAMILNQRPNDDLFDQSLKGLKGLSGVAVMVDPVPPAIIIEGPTVESLRKKIEFHLKKEGIPIIDLKEINRTPGEPKLRLSIEAITFNDVCACKVVLRLEEQGQLIRNKRELVVTSWLRGYFRVFERGTGADLIHGNTEGLSTLFASQYREANPK